MGLLKEMYLNTFVDDNKFLQQVEALRKDGKDFNEIGREVGMSGGDVRKILARSREDVEFDPRGVAIVIVVIVVFAIVIAVAMQYQ